MSKVEQEVKGKGAPAAEPKGQGPKVQGPKVQGPQVQDVEPKTLAALDELEAAETVDGEVQAAVQAAGAQSVAAQQADEERARSAEMGAAFAVGFMEKMLAMRLPFVSIEEGDKERLKESLAPVLAKHGGGMPGWLVPYKEEFTFGMTLAGVGFGVFMQVQAHRSERMSDAANKTGAKVEPKAPAPVHPLRPAPVSGAGADPLDPNAGE